MSALGVVRVRSGIVAALVAALSAGAVGCSTPAPGPAPASGAVSSAPAPSAVAPRAHRNAQYGYGLNPPPGWTSQPNVETGMKTTDFFLGPRAPIGGGKTVQPNLSILTTSSNGADLKAIAEANRQGVESAVATFRLLADEDLALADGRPAHLLGGTQQLPVGTLHTLQLIVVDKGRVFYVTSTSPEASFGRDEPALRASLTSFTLG